MTKRVAAVFLLTLTAGLLYARLAPSYTYELTSPLLDAHKYIRLYHFFRGEAGDASVPFPYNTRILMPWLAAHLPAPDMKTAFAWLTAFFSAVCTGALVVVWGRLSIRPAVWIPAVCWMVFHWKGILRMYLPDPANADSPVYAIQALWIAVWLAETNAVRRIAAFSLLAVVGMLAKEVLLLLPVLYWLWVWREEKRFFNPAIVPVLLALATRAAVGISFPPEAADWRSNSLITPLRVIWYYLQNAALIPRIPVSWFMAYGGFLLAGIVTWRSAFNETPRGNTWIFWGAGLWLVLSLVGGGDTSRIFFNGAPFVLTVWLLGINSVKTPWFSSLLLLLSVPLMRLTQAEPDPAYSSADDRSWCVECWSLTETLPYAAYALVLFAFLYFWLRRRAF
ncbi:hypothetical protein [Siphonobacter aquaeclarae]|uniref:DUF2029 domain-containing protein n=1 Tax=Siphonobacter aquaeclarae TaxID=563176 RepID=A0A1G9PVD6_9BACT|nr:hypothetical protein [Siphonobacter aquaeclarae]SDM02451.1 hypothetical protein SAMN04488090_2329 [Siphonobacter aquaeclarae]